MIKNKSRLINLFGFGFLYICSMNYFKFFKKNYGFLFLFILFLGVFPPLQELNNYGEVEQSILAPFVAGFILIILFIFSWLSYKGKIK